MSYRTSSQDPFTAGYSPAYATRQPSNASSSASAYSYYSHSSGAALSRTTTLSSAASSGYQHFAHKRAHSQLTSPPDGQASHLQSYDSSPEPGYKSVRESLRPLPQAPTSSPLQQALKFESQHSRSRSIEFSHATEDYDYHTPSMSPTKSRPNSLLLSRSDSVRRDGAFPSRSATVSHGLPHTPLTAPDLEKLEKSSTSHLRTLSKFAQSASADDFSIKSPDQEVVGLQGRRRLQKIGAQNGGRGGRNWMDKQRQFLQAYEYLCHIGEAKEWIEDIIQKPIPPIVQLEEALRDGVIIAEIVAALHPERHLKIFRHPKLQYRHSDNIAIFFRYLGEVELPDLFRFELIDLYEKKNIPKVIYCIHALSWLLYRQGVVDFRIGNLVGQLEFEHHELEAMQKGLDKAGVSMPSFGNMGADFGVEPEPEPVETEEEGIDRELRENEVGIVDLQAQIRGACVRMHLGDTMQSLWESEKMLVELQARIRGDFSRQIADYRLNMRRFAVNLQSAVRGFLVRTSQQSREEYWKNKEADILKLQNLIRAKRARDEVRMTDYHIGVHEPAIRQVQAAAKGFLARHETEVHKKLSKRAASAVVRVQATAKGRLVRLNMEVHEQFIFCTAAVVELQAAIRGRHIRRKISSMILELRRCHTSIENFQASAAAILTRLQTSRQRQALQQNTGIWRALQAASRGYLFRREFLYRQRDLKLHAEHTTKFQALLRAQSVRNRMARDRMEFVQAEPSIVHSQTIIRGMIFRKKYNSDIEKIKSYTLKISKLQACVRGFLFRHHNLQFLKDLKSNSNEIVQLQGIARAVLVRNRIGDLLEELEAEEDSIVALQAVILGSLVRARFTEKQRFFKENMKKVVKIQSFVRGRLQGEAYKSLTTGKNPPVNAVKNFVHLLNDSDFDFNEEIEFERLRKTVVQQVRQNEMAEQYIEQLDIKIALLVKNKITLDDVMQHQRSFGGHAGSLLTNTSLSSGNHFDLKALNKNSRKKLDSYQQLFFVLQTQPQYLARLFKRIREQANAESECKRIETLMMGLFGYAQKRREEYYLLKLLARSVKEEVDASSSVQDYLRGNFFWTRLLQNYTRSPRDRKFLRELLGPLIRDSIINDPALDLESDPLQIYRSAINNEELRTGQPSRRPLEVPREVAIRDRETRDLFVGRLQDLREIGIQFMDALRDMLHKMPFGIRYVAQQLFESLCERYPREPQQHHLQTVGQWLWRFYLQPALTAPQEVGVVEKQLSPLQKRNLGEVSKALAQITMGRIFGGDDIYMQPLNSWISPAIEEMRTIFSNMISVVDAETTFDIDEFNDLYSKTKPTLYIKMADIFAIHNLVAAELPHICPNRDDMLREIFQELGSAKNNETEMMGVSSGEIQMTLNPKLHDVEDPEAEVKALFMETKRCVLYIIRVQTGANLMEILVRPVTPDDEMKWHALLREEFTDGSNTRGAYADVNSLIDISSLSYAELKRTALENVMRLETQFGRISRHNYYQDILNAIALDIRTKSRRRIQRQRELEGVKATLGNLHEKAVWLESQRKSYDNYIEQAMMTLQNKKGKKRFLLPFTKQYNHERELQRTGRQPKFGSYKYSARNLFEKGVVVAWAGYSERQYDKINITISCDQVGVFFIEGSMGSIQIPGASAQVPLEDCLTAQFNNHQFMNLFDEGALRLNVNLFLHLIYKKFYRSGD